MPWVALITETFGGPAATAPTRIVPALVWARTRDEAERYIAGHHRNALLVRVFRADNRHHLGNARVVELTELA